MLLSAYLFGREPVAVINAPIFRNDKPIVFRCSPDCRYFDDFTCRAGGGAFKGADVRKNRMCPLFVPRDAVSGRMHVTEEALQGDE